MSRLRVFVTDDEAPARRKIVRFLQQDPEVEVVGEASNGFDAVRAIGETRPDLLFLDVQMPRMDGFEVVRALEPPRPRIVFCTAHDQYAIRAFEVHAFGYLLKPFDRERFERVLADAKEEAAKQRNGAAEANLRKLLDEVERRQNTPKRLLIQQGERAFFLLVDKIEWAEAERNYVLLHSGGQSYSIRGTLDSLEEKLDSAHFVRLNRSAIVRLDHIGELQSWFHGEYKVVLKSGETLTWTRRYVKRNPNLLQKI